MNRKIRNSAELIERIEKIGFLPLLNSGIYDFSAEDMVDEECRYTVFPDGGWDWPLWKWKGEVITEGGHVYGKFFANKAGFISRKWWPDLCNYRRSKYPLPVLLPATYVPYAALTDQRCVAVSTLSSPVCRCPHAL